MNVEIGSVLIIVSYFIPHLKYLLVNRLFKNRTVYAANK